MVLAHLKKGFRVYVPTYVIVFNKYITMTGIVSVSVLKNNTTSVYTRDILMCVKIYSESSFKS